MVKRGCTYEDFFGLVRSSRTYRRFDETRRLDEEDLLSVIDVARFSPCGNNLQVLRCVPLVDDERVGLCFAHHKWAGLIKDWEGPASGERPCAYLAICVPKGQGKSPIRNQDAGIFAQTLLLAARTKGWGGCMVKSYDKELDHALGIDQAGYETILLVALGYPSEEVVLEEVTPEHGVSYWHDDEDRNHVPKRLARDLVLDLS